uniref:Uncharacterized protein n=1 Tax=Panagrolaimus sp. JU765 TaxID=591449 RepID=A0AC34QYJ7_9BILA
MHSSRNKNIIADVCDEKLAMKMFARGNMKKNKQCTYSQRAPGFSTANAVQFNKFDTPDGWKLDSLPEVFNSFFKESKLVAFMHRENSDLLSTNLLFDNKILVVIIKTKNRVLI